MKTMKLRFAGTCAGCGAAVDTGQRAHYLRASKEVRCLTCGPTASTEPTVTAGASADREAARAAEQAEQLAAKHAAAERRASAFAAGAEGERIVAEALAPLSAAGYILLHDRAAGPRANLDHLVVGPSGVYGSSTRSTGPAPSPPRVSFGTTVEQGRGSSSGPRRSAPSSRAC
jgi:hypothetical protein